MENEPGHFELTDNQKLQERYDSLQMKHLAALEAGDEAGALEVEAEMNAITEQLGLDEEKIAA